MRAFVCASCGAVTKRLDGALVPVVCPFCRGTELVEDGVKAQREMTRLTETSSERPCERGEPCARLSGKDCPGGRGC